MTVTFANKEYYRTLFSNFNKKPQKEKKEKIKKQKMILKIKIKIVSLLTLSILDIVFIVHQIVLAVKKT